MRSAFSFAKKRQRPAACRPPDPQRGANEWRFRSCDRAGARADRRRALPLDEHQRSPHRRQNAASAEDCGSPGPSGGRSCRGREQPPRRHGRHPRSRTNAALRAVATGSLVFASSRAPEAPPSSALNSGLRRLATLAWLRSASSDPLVPARAPLSRRKSAAL